MTSEPITPRPVLAGGRIALWAVTVLGGAGGGLALSRLLFEAAPLRFAPLGGLWPSLTLGVVGGALAVGAAALLARRARIPHADATAGMSPLLLAWLYILTPPASVNPLRGMVLLAGAALLALGLIVTLRRDAACCAPTTIDWGLLIVPGAALLIYLITLQRTVGRADTFEFQVTAPVLGVAHPTGYPLYVMLGKVFSLLPLGKVATRVNLTSVVAASLTALLVYLTLRCALKVGAWAAGAGALALAASPALWSQAVIAEVYALHSAFAAAILGAALWLVTAGPPPRRGMIYHAPTSTGVTTNLPSHTGGPCADPARIVPITALLIGLSLTNHLTTVLLLPAVGLALLLAWPRLAWKRWLLAAGLLLAGLLVYAYIPIRWPALHEGRLMAVREFLGWVTGSRFSGALQLRAWLHGPDRWRIVGRLVLDQYGWPGAVLGAVGLIALSLKQWRAALVTALACAAMAFYGLNYLVPDIGVFLIPLYLVGALWMAYGVGAGLDWLGERFPPARRWLAAGGVSLFALIPMAAIWAHGPAFDWRDEQALEDWGRYVLSLPLDDGAAILADSEKIAPLEYLHRIEGQRPDMEMVVLGTEQEYLASLYARLDAGQTVYLARFLPGLEGPYHLRSVGPLIEVGTAPLVEPPPLDARLDAGWVNGVRLLGYDAGGRGLAPLHTGEVIHLTLYWTAPEPVANNAQIRMRLVDEAGGATWESAPAYAVSDRYPTVAWKAGEIIPDAHDIALPHTLAPGAYRLEVALAPPFSADLIPLTGGDSWVAVTGLAVAPGEVARVEGRRAAITLPGGAITGVSAPETAPGGGEAGLIVYWEGDPTQSLTVGAGGDAAAFDLAESGPALSYRVTAPTGQEAVEWTVGAGGLRCGWLLPLTNRCVIATTRIEGQAAAQAVANFDNQLLLTGIDFEAGQLQPGEQVAVTLTWQSLRAMDEDYTVFVHLLGPDGLLYGQVDAWPVQGTYPTSDWTPGEIVADRYVVPLDYDAPPGSYQLEIGVYLLGTNTRLSILGSDGMPVENRVLVGGLIVPG